MRFFKYAYLALVVVAVGIAVSGEFIHLDLGVLFIDLVAFGFLSINHLLYLLFLLVRGEGAVIVEHPFINFLSLAVLVFSIWIFSVLSSIVI